MFKFAPRTANVLDHYRELIEEILSDLGIDPADNLEEDFTGVERQLKVWRTQGVTDVRAHLAARPELLIELFSEETESYFMVDCPMLKLPPTGLEGFYRRLLELNDRLVEASLVIRGDEVHLVGIRPLKGMDSHEAAGMLDRISAWADSLDNPLSEEFKAPLWEPTIES